MQAVLRLYKDVDGYVFTLRMYTHADQESIRRASQIFRNAIKDA